jgi:hypothetical protein
VNRKHIRDRIDSQPTHEQPPHSEGMSTWGIRGTLAAVGVATLIAGFGGAAIYAATGSGDNFMGMHGPQRPPRGDGPGPAHDSGLGASADPAAALHGEFVVSDGKGGYATMLSQTGTVTAVDSTSVTARSADGFVQTYAIPSAATAADVAVDDQVVIRAARPRAGAEPTVTTIRSPMTAHVGG